ncbi:hypothetical protein ACJX0J_016205, partial [Zea mays]
MRAAAAASFHLAPATKPAHRRGCTTESCSLKPAPTARPPRLRSLAGRAPLVCASLGISHDKGFDISDPNVVGQNDLLIVGPGVLGRIIAEKWKKEHPSCKVYGQTASKNHHNELTDLGIIPSLKGTTIHQKVPHVIFCAPPSGSDDYPRDVRARAWDLLCLDKLNHHSIMHSDRERGCKTWVISQFLRLAASNWTGEGSFLFTSSTALYDCSDNSMCNEDCLSVPIGRSPRTDILLKVENVVLEAGGCIDRGAHVFWLRKGTLDTRPDHIINQIHYEDAASLAVAIMKKGLRSRIFLGCDNKPLSRQEIMDAVNNSGKFDTKFGGFT